MNHDEWLEWRRRGIGASDAPIIMGTAPKSWKTKYDLWGEKVFGISNQIETAAMRHGKDHEDTARQLFEKKMGVKVSPDWLIHPDMNWVRASLDGIDKDKKVMVEIKCPNMDDHFEASQGRVPEKYIPQCQHQLLVTGLKGMYYFSYRDGKGEVVEVPRDDKYIDAMLEEEKKFWQSVLDEDPPEELDLLFPDNPELISLIMANKSYRDSMKVLEKQEKESRNEIIRLTGEKSGRGHGIQLNKSMCKGAVDYRSAIEDYLANLRAHYPQIVFQEVPLEPYRKNSFVKWTIRDI